MNTLALWQTSVHSWGLVDWAKFIIIVAAVIGVVIVVLKVFEVNVPAWVWHIVWICVAAFVGILAITFLANL